MMTPAQCLEFWDTGVVMLPRAYSDDDLAPLRRQLDEWIEASRPHAGPFGARLDGRPRFDVEPEHSATRPALRRVASPEEISDAYLGLIEAGPLLDAVAALLGDDLRFRHARLDSQLPGSSTVANWHQDFTLDPHSNDDCVTAMLYLDEVDERSGAPRILPGSHRGALHSLWHDGIFTGAVDDGVAHECERHAIACPGPAGSLCLLHTRTLHAESRNLGARPRTLFIANLTAADAIPLTPSAMPSRHANRILRGRDPGRIRSIGYDMEIPETPAGASVFAWQARTGS